VKTRFASLLIRRHVIERLHSAYPNTWKTAALVTYRVLKKDIQTIEDIYHLFCRINRSNFDINNINLIVSCYGKDLWYLNKELFEKVMKTKLEIPSQLKNGQEIKNFVEQERMKILRGEINV